MNWKKTASRVEKVGYKTVTFKSFLMPDGAEAEYTTWGKLGDANVAVIALTLEKKVIISRQFRPGPEEIYDEIPGGGVEPNEELEAAAQRELLEETGYKATKIIKLGRVFRDSYIKEPSNYFMAFDCKLVQEQSLDQDEHVEVDLISIDQLIQNALDGKMSDGVGVLLAYEQLQKIKEI